MLYKIVSQISHTLVNKSYVKNVVQYVYCAIGALRTFKKAVKNAIFSKVVEVTL